MATVVEHPVRTRSRLFARFAWGVLGWNLFVILWGAFVRITDSGDGCGNTWPLCNGQVIPHSPTVHTLIEFMHRVSVPVTVTLVLALAAWGFLRFPRGHRVRKAAVYSIVFLVVESLLGAGLVLLGYTNKDARPGRAVYLGLHLANTLLLIAALTATAWFSRDRAPATGRKPRLVTGALWAALAVSITGVIAALGDTLFPATSLAEGMRQDLSAASHFLLRLRIVHPLLAVCAGIYFVYVAVRVLRSNPDLVCSRIAVGVLVLSVAQLCAGAVNLALLAPVPMQIIHLLLADILWIALVLLWFEARAPQPLSNPSRVTGEVAEPVVATQDLRG